MRAALWTLLFGCLVICMIVGSHSASENPAHTTVLAPATTISQVPTQCVIDPSSCSGMGWEEEPDEVIGDNR